MAAPLLRKRKWMHSSEDLIEDDKTHVSAAARNGSVESLEHGPDELRCRNGTTVPWRNTQKPLGRHNVARNASSYGSADYNSNMFKVQAEEMLQNVRPSYEKRMASVDTALRKVKQIIEDIPDQGPSTVEEAEKELAKQHKIHIPFPEPPPDKNAKYTFSYAKPTNINVVGSYARKTAISIDDQLTVDLAVTMPTKIFQEKDYLNYRYFYKRAYYLAQIAVGLKGSKDTAFDIEYAYQSDNHLQPVIIIKSNRSGGDLDFSRSRCQIRILLAADGDLFPFTRNLQDQNCIRSTSDDTAFQDIPNRPTPFYNASLRSECCSFAYLKFLHIASSQSEGFNDACMLGSIWLRQRGFKTGLTHGGFGPFEWACTVALLMQGGGRKGRSVLSKRYSGYQIFKATLLFLSENDLIKTPTLIGLGKFEAPGHEGPILFDAGRGLNILFKMASWSYTLLRDEASRTLNLLNDPYADQFNACFITKLDDPLQRFDCLVSFGLHRNSTKPLMTTDAYADTTQFCIKAHLILKTGLDDRVLLINISSPAQSPWAVTTAKPQASQRDRLLVGLLLNPEHVHRTVDRGPSAEDKEAASSFRRFWGEKAELRRFQDGSILESLIWSRSSNQSVLKEILAHVLRRHFGDEVADSLSIAGDNFDHMLSSEKIADPVALFQPVMTAYEVLEKQIRALEGMPLQIRQISAADAQLRYASLRVPRLDSARSRMITPAKIYIQFEGSSRWPDDLAAVQRTKTAFLLKLGELFEASASASRVSTRLALESQSDELQNVAYLDICYSSGAFFRLRIHHERELTLLQRSLTSASSERSKEAIATALSGYKRNFIQLPLHTQAVRTLSTRFPLLSPSVRLLKKWRDSHLLSHHISDELTELLTIRSFVQPYPWAIPGSVITGFLRTLTFISKWDWRSDPLIIDFSGEMTTADYDAINTRFQAWRKIDPAMNRIAMFAASNLDPEGISWTEMGPSKVVAARLTSLARAACAVVKEQGIDVQAATLFASSLADYDFVVHLDRRFVGDDAGRKAGKSAFKNWQIQEQQDRTRLNFQPVNSFLEELRKLYGSNVIFFYDEDGGSIIGGLWNPQTGPRSWKVHVEYSTAPIKQAGEEDGEITINKAGTLHDIARLGGDLISKIQERH